MTERLVPGMAGVRESLAARYDAACGTIDTWLAASPETRRISCQLYPKSAALHLLEGGRRHLSAEGATLEQAAITLAGLMVR